MERQKQRTTASLESHRKVWGWVLSFFMAFGGAPLAARADAPGQINYQGKLADPAGNPRNGTHNLRFDFYTESSLGILLYSEEHDAVLVQNGVFNVRLGGGTVLGGAQPNLAAAVQSDPTVWMEIRVGATVLAPRQQLLAAPYALAVPVGVGSQWSNEPNGINYTGGNVGIGAPASGSYKLNVDGDINISGGLSVDGQPAVFSNWAVDGLNIFRNSNVGIGMAAGPVNYRLHVVDPADAVNTIGLTQFISGALRTGQLKVGYCDGECNDPTGGPADAAREGYYAIYAP